MKRLCLVLMLLSVCGCLAIPADFRQPVMVQTVSSGVAVAGARCEVTGGDAAGYGETQYLLTPASAVIKRSDSELIVRCEKEGFLPVEKRIALSPDRGTGRKISSEEPYVIGPWNHLISGEAVDYPPPVVVEMKAIP